MFNKRFIIQRFRFPKIPTCQVFYLSCGWGNVKSTNIVGYLYLFRSLFVCHEGELDYHNKIAYSLYMKAIWPSIHTVLLSIHLKWFLDSNLKCSTEHDHASLDVLLFKLSKISLSNTTYNNNHNNYLYCS